MPPAVQLIAAGLVAAAVGAPGGLAACRQSPSHFPLADGNRWTLAAAEGTVTRTLSIRRSTLQGLPGAGPLRVRARGETVEAWDAADGRFEPLFRLGAPAGTRYRVDLPRTALWRDVHVTVASRSAAVRAAGRVHRGSVRLLVRARKPVADAGVEELAFAPGVGPVRIVEGTIAGPRTLLLRSYRIRG